MPMLILFILWLGLSFNPALGLASPFQGHAAGGLRASERWALEKITAGELADLQQRFGAEEASRQVRAEFLVRLVTTGFPGVKIPYQGVRLSGGIIVGDLDLENAEVDHWLELLDCQFVGAVNLRDGWFKKGLTLSRSRFLRQVEMQRLRVALSANFSESSFQGPVDLWRAQITGILQANNLRCEDPGTVANFSAMHIGQAAFFNQAVFRGPVNLGGCKIGDLAQFAGTAFGAELSCFGARIGSQLNIAGAQFAGLTDFGYVSVGSQLIADGARFHHATAPANFNGLQVAHSAFFRKVEFAGPVNFISASVGSEFQLDGARFGGQLADFNNLKVSQHLFFRGAGFAGPVNFTGASVGGELVFLRTQFSSPTQPASIKDVQVSATAYFWDSLWAGGLDLSGARLHKAILGFPPDKPGEIAKLTLEHVVIDRTLRLENLQIGQFEARKLTVKDGAELVSVAFQEGVDLRESVFGALTFRHTTWPQKTDALWLEGLTYQSLGASGNGEDWQSLVHWVEQGRYDTRTYGLLETFFRQSGYKDRADEVFIKGKRREILNQWWRPDNLATFFFWDLLAGYGRKPGRTFWLGLMIVVVGMFVFGEKNFDPTFIGSWNWLREGGPGRKWVFRFFLSLDQFLPGIDLGLAKLWNLSQVSYGELIYYHFHKLSGWILIPIGLAALYSQFR